MFRNLYIGLILFALMFSSCKINRMVKGYKQGKWVHTAEDETERLLKHGYRLPEALLQKGYYYTGRYRRGKERGTWRYFMDGKLIRKEKYKGNEAWVCYYYPNGKVQREGKTFFEITDKMTHWYYTGNWNYYNETGDLISTKIYDKGTVIKEIDFKPKN